MSNICPIYTCPKGCSDGLFYRRGWELVPVYEYCTEHADDYNVEDNGWTTIEHKFEDTVYCASCDSVAEVNG